MRLSSKLLLHFVLIVAGIPVIAIASINISGNFGLDTTLGLTSPATDGTC